MGLIDKTKQILGLLKVEPITNTAGLLETCQSYAAKQIARDAKVVQLDAELQLVKDQHEGAIEALNTQLEHEGKRIRTWAEANRATMFGDKQSYIIQGHELAFQESPGAVAFEEGHDAESVLQAILSLPGVTDEDQSEEAKANDALREAVLRVKAELDKNAMLRFLRRKDAPEGAKLKQLGVKVKRVESFKFTPARTEVPDAAASVAGKDEGRAAA